MSRFEKWSVWITAAAASGTGVVYLWMKYFMETDVPWAVVNHPLEPWVLKAHIVASPLFVLVLGAILFKHVPQHLREPGRPRLASGISVLATAGIMILSGYLVQVITHEAWLEVTALTHIFSSLVFMAILVWHSVRIGRSEVDSEASDDSSEAARTAPLSIYSSATADRRRRSS